MEGLESNSVVGIAILLLRGNAYSFNSTNFYLLKLFTVLQCFLFSNYIKAINLSALGLRYNNLAFHEDFSCKVEIFDRLRKIAYFLVGLSCLNWQV